MKRWVLILALMALVGTVIACGQATPPIVAPNFEDGLEVDPPTAPVPATDSGAAGNDGSSSGETPELAIEVTSVDDAFAPGELVEIGIDLDSSFAGVAPEVGPLAAAADEIDTVVTITANGNGGVTFGVYLSASTTPGIYTVYAMTDAVAYGVEIEIIAAP